MKKRMTIVLGGLLIVLGSSYAMAGELSGEVVRVGMMPSAVGAPVQYAIENGYFEEEGIEVETLIFPNGGAINEAVAAGEMDVCCSGAATVFALANGSNVLLGDVEMSGGMGIWAREGDEIFNTRRCTEPLMLSKVNLFSVVWEQPASSMYSDMSSSSV